MDPFETSDILYVAPSNKENSTNNESSLTATERAARSYYVDPVGLDAVYSRQYIRFQANGVQLMGLLDGGAEVNLMPRSTYLKHFSRLPLVPDPTPLRGVFGKRGETLDGLIQLHLNIDGETINANFAVANVPSNDTVIIGIRLMDSLRLCLAYDESGTRLVKLGPSGRVVPSCIKVGRKFIAVRALRIDAYTGLPPMCRPRSARVMSVHLDMKEFLRGLSCSSTRPLPPTA